MFRIADGREYFYQWDLDRQVIVEDPSVKEVHFCNRTNDCSLVTEVIDGRANVPNILLQSSFDIRVFGYDGKATLHDKKFKVYARTQPADYVYTETAVKSIEEVLTAAEQVSTITTEFYEFVDEYKLGLVDDGEGNVELKAVEKEEGGSTGDLSDYYTKAETDAKIEEVVAAIPEVDLSAYATKVDTYADMNPTEYLYEYTNNISIGRVPFLPLKQLSVYKNNMKYIRNNFTLEYPLIWDAQTELKLVAETDYDTTELTMILPEPAVTWVVNWLDGTFTTDYAYKVLDKSKLHLGENGTVYTTLEEQGWVPHMLGAYFVCDRLSRASNATKNAVRIDDNGKITITINPSATAEANLATINSLGDFTFVYRKDWAYCTWEQLCEPLNTVATEEDDRWFYACMPDIESDEDNNIAFSCTYHKPIENYIGDITNRLEGVEGIDLSDYSTKEDTAQAIQDALDAIGVAEGGSY